MSSTSSNGWSSIGSSTTSPRRCALSSRNTGRGYWTGCRRGFFIDGAPERVLQDAQHWLDRAEEAHGRAEQMSDVEAKDRMLSIAAGYEKMAGRAKIRAGTRFDSKLNVQVAGNSIIVTLLGTIYSVT